jgi:hypothetical protein
VTLADFCSPVYTLWLACSKRLLNYLALNFDQTVCDKVW